MGSESQKKILVLIKLVTPNVTIIAGNPPIYLEYLAVINADKPINAMPNVMLSLFTLPPGIPRNITKNLVSPSDPFSSLGPSPLVSVVEPRSSIEVGKVSFSLFASSIDSAMLTPSSTSLNAILAL